MNEQEEYVWFIDGMLDKAYHDYLQTEEYAAAQAEIHPLEQELRNRLPRQDYHLVSAYLDQLNASSGQQERYLYRRGLTDCIPFLKWLGVIA